MMWRMIWPIALVVMCNVFYNIVTKSTPQDSNALLSLTVTYLVAAVSSFALYWLSGERQGLLPDLGKLNWTAFALGAVVVGLEFAYIHVYRAGWQVNMAPLVANTCLACVLLPVGFALFRETISPRQLLGAAACIVGVIIINY